MHREEGVVIELSAGRALVESEVSGMCSSCQARHACMSGGEKKRRIWIDNVLGAQQGDCVVFSIDEKDVVVSSLVLYLVPVVFLIAGAAMGASLHGRLSMDRDSLAALGGAAGFLLSLIVVALVSRLAVRRGVFSPRMLDVSGRR